MTAVELKRTRWADVTKGMKVFHGGSPVVVKQASTNEMGHRRVTLADGRTVTMRAEEETAQVIEKG